MKRILIATMLMIFSFGTVSAQSQAGSAGAQFLKIGVGSKYQAMGEAAVAVAGDVYSMYWNPAGLTGIENSEVSFTNVNYLLDIDLNYIGYAKRFEDIGVFGVSATLLSMDEQEITTFEEQEGTGDYYSATSYAIGLSFARRLTNRFSFGATVKYVGEKIHNEEASGIAIDFGTLLETGFRSLRLGMSITNMGPEMEFSGSDLMILHDDQSGEGANSPVSAELNTNPYDLPLVFRVGLAYDMEMGPNSILTLSGEVKHPNDGDQRGALGAQWGFKEQFFLRGGYKLNYDEEGLTLGGGVFTNLTGSTRMVVDYAWQDFGRLESTQRFSVGFTF